MSLLAISTLIVLPTVIVACGGPQVSQDPFDPLGPWHQRHITCGTPAFFHRLPLDAQAKIRDIWAHYEAGDECDKEKEATRQVIQSIPDEVRFSIFKGMCGPSFLKNADQAVRSQFQNVWFNDHLSLDEKEAEFKKLAYSLLTGDAVSEQNENSKKFNEFESSLQERKKQRQQTIDALSPAAQEAYNKWNQMRKEERLYLAGLSQEIRAELKLVCTYCGTSKVGTGNDQHHLRSRRSARADALDVIRSLRQSEQEILLPQNDCASVF
ncbi:hypothetical protein M3Y94_01152000 [Aphelenchoides besseyi]|nr:hypothetical protein M3Y94_01152000 [Aphelenchoides besseyi]